VDRIIKKIVWSIALGRVIISHILAQIYQKENLKVYCFNRDLLFKQINPKIEVEINRIKNSNDLEKYIESIPSTYFIKFNIFLKYGCTGFFATKGEELVSFCWLTDLKKYCPSPYIRYLFPNLDAAYYIFYLDTLEKYRGNRLGQYILYYILDKEIKDNFVYIDTDVSNISAQKCIERVGFKLRYVISYLRLFQREVYAKKEFINSS